MPTRSICVVLASALSLASCGNQETPSAQASAATSIFIAAETGDLFTLRGSLTSQNIDSTDAAGYTPMMLATQGGQVAAMRYLVSMGANVNAKHTASGADLMMMLVATPKGFSTEALEFLLQQGLSPNYRTPSGETALQFAAEMKNETAVFRLLQAGAIPTKKTLMVVVAADYPNPTIATRIQVAASKTG